MRGETTKEKLQRFMAVLGRRVSGSGRIYLTGGATAVEFFHYDPYGQALSKLQRGHDRDLQDVEAFCASGLVRCERLLECFGQIKPALIRYPGIDPRAFESSVCAFCLLYRLLREQGGDAYSRYNSLLRELASFEQAIDGRIA